MANSEKTYQHWIEIVRTFRTYYDHFRIAFPNMHQIPKFYTNDWASEFRLSAREFARKEDMEAVKRLFDGAGYGTERWEKLTALSAESIAEVLSQAMPMNGKPAEVESRPAGEDVLGSIRQALGEERFNRLLADPAAFGQELDRLESDLESEDQEVVDAEVGEPEAEAEPVAEVVEEETSVPPEAVVEPEAEDSVDEPVAHLINVLGETRWQALLDDPEAAVRALDGAGDGAADEPVLEAEATVDEDTERAPAENGSTWSQEEAEAAIKALETKNDGLTSDVETLNEEREEADQNLKRIQVALDEKERELQTMAKKIKSLEEKAQEAESQKGREPEKANLPPTQLSQQLEEYEKIVQRSEEQIAELEAQTEKDELVVKEMAEDLKREKYLRQKFEDDLGDARNALREQVERLHSVLKGDPEIPSIDEFEQMENEELLDYIGDVEKEKQRVLAGLDAIDAQEESYKKQIDVQQEELGAIQEDIQNMKGSNLAMEVEEMKATVEKQRSQLQTLMGYSKNLKTRAEQLTERQEPMRRLVQKLNLQEKALVRYVRLNYDNKFMPENILRA